MHPCLPSGAPQDPAAIRHSVPSGPARTRVEGPARPDAQPLAAPLADAGSPPAAAKNPRQRPLDILGQARGLTAARLDAIRARQRASLLAARPTRPAGPEPEPRVRGFRGLANVPAIPALDLAEPPDQVHATADRAPVKVSCPVEGRLTAWADEHLTIGPHPSFPGALPAVRVYLPRPAAIAGHPACPFSRPPTGRPARGRPAPSGSRRCHAPPARDSRSSTEPRHPCR
jgi:hypothetical protein